MAEKMGWYAYISIYFSVKPDYPLDINDLQKKLGANTLYVLSDDTDDANLKRLHTSLILKYGSHRELSLQCHLIRKVVGDDNLTEIDGEIFGENWYAQANMRLAKGEGAIRWKFDGSMELPPIDPELDKYADDVNNTTKSYEECDMYADDTCDGIDPIQNIMDQEAAKVRTISICILLAMGLALICAVGTLIERYC